MSSRLIPQSRGWLKRPFRVARPERMPGSSAQAPGSGKDDSLSLRVLSAVRALFTRERSKRLHGPSIRDRLRPGWRRFPPWLDIIPKVRVAVTAKSSSTQRGGDLRTDGAARRAPDAKGFVETARPTTSICGEVFYMVVGAEVRDEKGRVLANTFRRTTFIPWPGYDIWGEMRSVQA